MSNNDSEIFLPGEKNHLYDMDGVPARIVSADSIPETLHADGKWLPFYDTWTFIHSASPVTQEEFDKNVKEYIAFMKS